jgi:hypothetical protein
MKFPVIDAAYPGASQKISIPGKTRRIQVSGNHCLEPESMYAGYIDGEIVPIPSGLIGFPWKHWCPANRVSTIEAATPTRG